MNKVRAKPIAVRGFKAAGVHAGLKKEGALDVAVITSDRDCVTAGVFTRNQVKAASVTFNQRQLQQNPTGIRTVAVNTRYANALTGEAGVAFNQAMAEAAAEQQSLPVSSVLVMSTGVIGVLPPRDKIFNGITKAVERLGDGWEEAAQAIMTTDTRHKIASIEVMTINGPYRIMGLAKGSGMIAPNMATMLGVIVTDAKIDASTLNSALQTANQQTFNRIVVDGDTSTNDMVTVMANGASGVTLDTPADVAQFTQALTAVCELLAKAIVRDGEGATKFITVHVTGASSVEQAEKIGHTIASSALVKTAFFGNDANWGRIIAAAGRAGVAFNPDTARLWLSAGESPHAEDESPGLLIFDRGQSPAYSEQEATAIISETDVTVTLYLGDGTAEAIIWTCDLSHDYVSINGDYRT